MLVCDLGGGTYDATILQMKGGVLKTDKTRGAHTLGGHDWTTKLVELVLPCLVAQTGHNPGADPQLLQRLQDLCEQTKCQLSSVAQAAIPWTQGGKSVEVSVSREEFEDVCRPLIGEALDKTQQVVEDARLTMADLQHVLVVGGSSRLPSFVAEIAAVTGKTPLKTRNPDEAVARGAALVAHGFASGRSHAAPAASP